MTTPGTWIHTRLFGRRIGADAFGNVYFEHRRTPKAGLRRSRWVVYNGMAEPSKVPAEWHGWLHYTTDAVPENQKARAWRKEHQPNLTGTTGAYLPQGHIQRQGFRPPDTTGYEPWRPS